MEPARLVEQALYLLGSAFFFAGTALFTPPMPTEPTAGEVVVNVLGQTYYLATGSVPEAPEARLASGDALFVVGSAMYSIAAFVSALFATGAGSGEDPVSVAQRRTSVATASLYELGGVAFVIGTLGFYPAGLLGMGTCPEGTRNLETAGAWLFVAGSVCYSIGSAVILAFEAWLTYGNTLTPAEGGDGDGRLAASPAAEGEAARDRAAELAAAEALELSYSNILAEGLSGGSTSSMQVDGGGGDDAGM